MVKQFFKMSNGLAYLCNRIFHSTSTVVFDMIDTDTSSLKHVTNTSVKQRNLPTSDVAAHSLHRICVFFVGIRTEWCQFQCQCYPFPIPVKACVGFNNMTLSPGGEVLIKNILLEKEALTTEELCILLLELRFQYELKKRVSNST